MLPIRLIIFVALVFFAGVHWGRAAEPADEPLPADTSFDLLQQNPEWKKTLREFDTWAAVQKIYEPGQIKEFRAKIVSKASKLSGMDQDDFREDLNERLQVLLSDEARAARQWLGETLSVASDSYAKELRKKYDAAATMSATQLEDKLAELAQRRSDFRQYREGFDATRKLQVDAAKERAARQEAASRAAQSAPPSSSYHPGYNYNGNSNKKRDRYTPIPPVYSGGHSGLGGLGFFGW